MDLHTLEKIRAEVEKRSNQYDNHQMHASFKLDGSEHTKKDWYRVGLTDVLTYLDTEIANAKGV